MKDDVEYRFVKGQGWIPLSPGVGYLRDFHGKTWKVTEVSIPKPGDRWDAIKEYGISFADFQDYLSQRDNKGTPSIQGIWKIDLVKLYNVYFIYEEM